MGWEDNAVFYFVFASLTFFVWMDMSFFGEMQEQGLIANSTETITVNWRFPVKMMKLRMQDHMSHYVWMPLSEHIDAKYELSKNSNNIFQRFHFLDFVIFSSVETLGSQLVSHEHQPSVTKCLTTKELLCMPKV